MISKACSMLALAAVLTLAPMFASAQVTPPPGGKRQRLELERRLNLGFQRSIQNQLGLEQAELQGIQEINQSFQEERRALNRAQASVRLRLRDPALRDIGEDEAKALLQELVDVQQRELDLYTRERGELLKLMTPVKLIRYYGLREGLGRRVQELRQGGRGPGKGGRGPGGVGGGPTPMGGRGVGGRPLR